MTSILGDRHLSHFFATRHAMKVKASSEKQLLSQVFTRDPLHIILFTPLAFSCTSNLFPWLQYLPLTLLIFVEQFRLHCLVHLSHSYMHCTSSSENICKFSNQRQIRDKLPGLPLSQNTPPARPGTAPIRRGY